MYNYSSKQNISNKMISRLILAWDSDYTKLTPAEYKRLEVATQELNEGEIIDVHDIDWD